MGLYGISLTSFYFIQNGSLQEGELAYMNFAACGNTRNEFSGSSEKKINLKKGNLLRKGMPLCVCVCMYVRMLLFSSETCSGNPIYYIPLESEFTRPPFCIYLEYVRSNVRP